MLIYKLPGKTGKSLDTESYRRDRSMYHLLKRRTKVIGLKQFWVSFLQLFRCLQNQIQVFLLPLFILTPIIQLRFFVKFEAKRSEKSSK
jgi:hypothetical protein